jgi:hypothetical protein
VEAGVETLLDLVSGLAWTIVYFDCIRVGLRQGTYAIPAAALALNFSWETIYAIHGLTARFQAQTVVDVVWGLADLMIVYTFLRFGRREFAGQLTPVTFGVGAAGLFAVAFALQGLFAVQFGWDLSGPYSAFLQNVLMSGLFIAMLLSRGGDRGQTPLIATMKWLGTLAPTIEFAVVYRAWFVVGLGVLCSVLDIVYLGLLLRVCARRAAAPAPGGSPALRATGPAAR